MKKGVKNESNRSFWSAPLYVEYSPNFKLLNPIRGRAANSRTNSSTNKWRLKFISISIFSIKMSFITEKVL